MKEVLLIIVVLSAKAATAQTAARPPLERLYDQASRSEFVVTGRVVGRTPLGQIRKETTPQGEKVYVGPPQAEVYTIAVNEVLCRQTDFKAGASQRPEPPSTIHLFEVAGHGRESDSIPGRFVPPAELLPDRDYLLYLYRHPDQSALVSEYKLDKNVTYYIPLNGSSGAIERQPAPYVGAPRDRFTDVFSAITGLCEAVRPADVTEKVTRLRSLAESADPRILDSVETAIRVLEEGQKQLVK